MKKKKKIINGAYFIKGSKGFNKAKRRQKLRHDKQSKPVGDESRGHNKGICLKEDCWFKH